MVEIGTHLYHLNTVPLSNPSCHYKIQMLGTVISKRYLKNPIRGHMQQAEILDLLLNILPHISKYLSMKISFTVLLLSICAQNNLAYPLFQSRLLKKVVVHEFGKTVLKEQKQFILYAKVYRYHPKF